MTFPTFELNVYLAPAFVAAVDEAMQSERAELVLFYATTAQHGLFALRDYLQARAREAAASGRRPVTIVQSDTSGDKFADGTTVCQPGELVLFSELGPRPQPGNWQHAVSAASLFVDRGATVFASIHGPDLPSVQERLAHLWRTAISERLVPASAKLPAHRFVQFEAHVKESPVSARRGA